MATNILIILAYFPLWIVLLLHCNHAAAAAASFSCFKSIIGFGDSLADTGNLLHLTESDTPLYFELLPYGETFFHRPTGRFSDGRLIIDFIAEFLGLPLVTPFHDGKNSSRRSSVNFAVAGANALPDSFFLSKGIAVPHPNTSLENQLNWFKKLFLPKFYPKSSDRKKYLESSLVVVGEIGGNDYNHPFMEGRSVEDVESFVPQVVNAIASAVEEVIKVGAVTVVVPGNLPIGCSAANLATFQTSNTTEYDPETGCLIRLNEFAGYHNNLLRSKIAGIQKQNPNTKIIYADYYNAAMSFYRSPRKYGFAKGGLTPCCPNCTPFYKTDRKPEQGGGEVCVNASEYVSWDGVHLTEAAYKVIATALLLGDDTIPRLSSICPNYLPFNVI